MIIPIRSAVVWKRLNQNSHACFVVFNLFVGLALLNPLLQELFKSDMKV